MEPVENKRLRKLQELGLDRPLVAGSINRVERRDAQGRTTAYYLLTFKEAGKTRSVYVPKDLVKEVRSWIRNHRRVKQLLSEISTLSIAIIRRHVTQQRASARGAGVKRRAKRNSP
jgi:RNA polymerase-interacting CarD/CdnL/TRCF family regulator